jgi:translocation and assembly module TamB
MAAGEDMPAAAGAAADAAGRSWWRWLLGILFLLALLLAAAVPLGLWFLAETPRGRAFVAAEVAGIETDSGIHYTVGRIDGSLLSRFTLVDVEVLDLKGTLAVIPEVRVDWEPITLISSLVSLNRLDIPEVRLLRMWALNPRDPDKPLLPDIDARIGRFEVTRLVLEAPVLGRREQLFAAGRADIRSGRVLLDTQVRAEVGDRLLLLLDAEPDRDRFELEADLRAPAGGVVATAAGLGAPLAVVATGSGSWTRWRGRLDADIGAGEAAVRVAALRIEADDGRFRVRGDLKAEPFVDGTLAALAAPAIAVDATAGRDGDRFDIRFVASSPALALTGGGGIDAEETRLDGVRVEAVLKQPALVNPQLSGTGLAATLTAEGAVADPAIGWSARASTLRWKAGSGLLGADGVQLQGSVRLAGPGRPLAIPFTASAARPFGLPPETAALLQQPRLSGTLTFADGNLRGTGLRFASSRVTASGDAALLANGRATGSGKAAVPRFDVEGLGTVSLAADVRFDRAPGGRPSVAGNFEGRALALSNAGALDFLGGLPTLSGGFTLSPAGTIAVSGARFTSPNLGFADARASYDPASGRFTLDAAGKSRSLGPIAIAAAGTSAAPAATVRMASPGFGFGITDLVAEISPAAGGVLVVARGDSPQGPLDGRVVVGFGQGRPLSLDIERASIASLGASGRLVQTPAGPFAGRLEIDGQGVEAQLDFSAQGELQRIDAKGRAQNARLPLPTPITIGGGAVRGSLLLVPGRPHLTGSFRFTGVQRETVLLTSLEGTANIAGPSGLATISARGRAGDGEPIVANARVQSVSDGYALSLDGSLGKLPLKLERPARIVRADDHWELKPARLILPKGQIDLAGRWGEASEAKLVLRDVDLSLLDFLAAGSGLGGRASGEIAVRQSPGAIIPTGEANLAITGLQRAGVTGITVPVDVRIAAQSDGAGLLVGARLAWQKNDLGRLVLRVDPGPGATPAERFLAGRISGGVRYNGPVEPLWALAGLEGQELKGPIALGADFAGTPDNPELTGIARGKGLIYRNALLGTEIVDLAFDGVFSGSDLKVNSITGRANGGTLKGAGLVRFDATAERSIDLSLDLARARLANSDILEVTLSGPLRLKGAGSSATLTGDLRVDSARIQLVQVETSEVPQLAVRRAGEVPPPQRQSTLTAGAIKLDVRVRADDRVRVEGMGLDSIWRGDIRIRGSALQPQFLGQAVLAEGEFSFAGSDFDITSGRVGFNGAPLDSSISIRAQTQAEDVTAFVTISGTAARPDIRFSSSPTLPEDEILARLLFGSSVADLSVTEALQLATAVAGLQSGVDTMGKIRRSVGVDRLRLVGENEATGMGTGLAIGKRLTRNLYVEVLTDSQGNTLSTLQFTLSRIWSLFLEVSSQGQNSINLRYQREY